MSPPGYSNGHADPVGAEHQALISAVARGVAKLEAAEKSFGLTAKLLVKDSKETRGEVDELKGSVLRIEGKLDRLVEVVGRPPEAVDPVEVIKRMQTTSVQGLTADQVVAREERVRAELEERAKGTGLFGIVAEGAHIDRLTMAKLQEVAEQAAEKKAQSVVGDAKDAAATSNKSVLIKGSIGAVIVAIIMALGGVEGITSGTVRVIHALQGRDLPPVAP